MDRSILRREVRKLSSKWCRGAETHMARGSWLPGRPQEVPGKAGSAADAEGPRWGGGGELDSVQEEQEDGLGQRGKGPDPHRVLRPGNELGLLLHRQS